jgi:benzodiazapine receptor
MNERLKPFLVIVATVGMILVNWMAGKGYINGITTGEISDKYETFITPAGYAFAIWGLIYLGLIAFSIYQALPKNAARFRSVRSVYILSCVINCAWIYFWHYEMILICLAVIFALLGTLVFINLKLRNSETKAETMLIQTPFALYFGWVTVAAILNSAIALVYLGVNVTDATATIFACILIIAAVALGAIIRPVISNSAYPLAIAWALTAIAVKQSGKTAIIFFCAFGVIALLVSALSFVMKEKSR